MNNLTPSTAQPSGWTDEAYRKWWYRMGEIFGKPWFEKNGPEPSSLWRESLKRMPMEKAGAVLEHYRKAGLAFPPNMSEVVETAGLLRQWEPPQKTLPRPRSHDAALRAMTHIKELVKQAHLRYPKISEKAKIKPFNDVEFNRLCAEERARQES